MSYKDPKPDTNAPRLEKWKRDNARERARQILKNCEDELAATGYMTCVSRDCDLATAFLELDKVAAFGTEAER